MVSTIINHDGEVAMVMTTIGDDDNHDDGGDGNHNDGGEDGDDDGDGDGNGGCDGNGDLPASSPLPPHDAVSVVAK